MKGRSEESRNKATEKKTTTSGKGGGGTGVRVSVRSVQVRHLDAPPTIKKPKRIHARRLAPFVAEGVERNVHSRDTRAWIARPQDAGQDIQVVLNTPLTQPAQNRTSSNVGEPSVSINGDVVFFTGNWYAAISVDGGNTFKFIDPNSMAQPNDPQGVTFCCDQVVNYMPSIDTFMWLMQYGPSTGDNIQRLAFATTDNVKAGKWQIFDITTQLLEIPGFFMDFPDLAVGANFIYMTTNCFGSDNQTVGSAVVRIPLTSLAQGSPTIEKYVDMNFFSFRVVQNSGSTTYFASHKDTSTLTVFTWPEADATPTQQDVGVARWIGTSAYSSRTPDGRRWLDRVDPRITGATMAGTELWFAWAVDAGSNQRPQPFVQMARLNSADMSVIENVNLFDMDSAISYAGLSTNSNNEVGVSYAIGGAVFPSHVVGFMTGDRKNQVVGKGDRGPLADSQGHFDWGDYLTVRPVFSQSQSGKLFAATGYSLVGTQDGDDLDATPRFVIFGRPGDTGGSGSSSSDGSSSSSSSGDSSSSSDSSGNGSSSDSGSGSSSSSSGAVGSGPITDVNQLATVTPDVSAQIKTACGVHIGTQAAARPQVAIPELVTKPGKERWPVKTGQDPDRDGVGKNVVNGQDLGAGIVPATVEELISMPRPAGMEDPTVDPPEFQNKRANLVELTIWQVEGTINVLNQESDGDYHLVFQGPSGATLVAEVPTPTTDFVGDSPWLQNIHDARQTVDDKLVQPLSPNEFVLPPGGKKLVPQKALSGDFPVPAVTSFQMRESFRTPAKGETLPMPTFQAAVPPTRARITGVGFFDRSHGATGAAPNVFEIHPVLKVEWL